MISKRSRRPGKPQETLRQFALNNSKGVDGTKSPTDSNTVYRANNLIVNSDGSMSLRKPITCIENTVIPMHFGARTYTLYDGVHRIVALPVLSGYLLSIEDSYRKKQPILCTYTKYTGESVEFDVASVYDAPNVPFVAPNKTLEVVNTSTSTILGNCNVLLNDDNLEGIVDKSLYDDDVDRLPRYLQIYRAEDSGRWILRIISPEVNTLTTAAGEIPFNPNMTLDNPFAVRDTYNSVVPAIKGILAYVPSKLVNGELVPGEVNYSESGASATSSAELGAGLGNTLDSSKTQSVSIASHTISEELQLGYTIQGNSFTTELILKLTTDISNNSTYKIDVTQEVNASMGFRDAEGALRYESATAEQSYTFQYSASELHTTMQRSLKCSGECTRPASGWEPDGSGKFTVTVSISYTEVSAGNVEYTTSDITESVKRDRFRIATAIEKNTNATVLLKAFCNIPKDSSKYYAAWSCSSDGITWEPLQEDPLSSISVKELSDTWTSGGDVEDAPNPSKGYVIRKYAPFKATNQYEASIEFAHNEDNEVTWINARPDIVCINVPGDVLGTLQYRFKIIAVEPLSEGAPEYSEEDSEDTYRVYATIAQSEYTPVFKPKFEFATTDLGNAVYGKKLYHKKAIYSYGYEKFLNNIFVSDIDSFITPLYNIIDLDAQRSSKTSCVVPWRDYLVSATDNAVYLHSKQEDGFLTKTVNTSVGIPAVDSACCKPILNGIIFKAGTKIYQLYPNVYSGDDSTLNLTELSKPIEEYLEAYRANDLRPFAFSTTDEYVLMLPSRLENSTLCLRYDYTAKTWTVCTYPILMYGYEMLDISDIRISGIYGSSLADYKFDGEPPEGVYADTVPVSQVDVQIEHSPIEFEWDTGQKTDNISIAKQFVESKLVFATEDMFEQFPIRLTIHVDGDPHVTVLDLNSDAPFWKEEDSVGVANTVFRLGDRSVAGVFRQLIARYSGKGKSVRHILQGAPTSNFRLYETYVRYKILNVKR